jgi:hypothetical protein
MAPASHPLCTTCCLPVYLFIVWGSVLYTYQYNQKLPDTDPGKKEFSFWAGVIAPLTLPLFISSYIIVFVITSIAFGCFLVMFPVLLLMIRKPFLFEWLRKGALFLGHWLFKLNGLLLRPFANIFSAFLASFEPSPQPERNSI